MLTTTLAHICTVAFRHNYPPSRTLIKWQWQQKQQEDEEEEAKRKITITLNRQPLVQWSNFYLKVNDHNR